MGKILRVGYAVIIVLIVVWLVYSIISGNRIDKQLEEATKNYEKAKKELDKTILERQKSDKILNESNRLLEEKNVVLKTKNEELKDVKPSVIYRDRKKTLKDFSDCKTQFSELLGDYISLELKLSNSDEIIKNKDLIIVNWKKKYGLLEISFSKAMEANRLLEIKYNIRDKIGEPTFTYGPGIVGTFGGRVVTGFSIHLNLGKFIRKLFKSKLLRRR